MRKLALVGVCLLAAPLVSSCAVVGAGVHAVGAAVTGVADAIHELAFSGSDDAAPMGYTRDALAEAAVLYPPALTTVVVPPNHPRLLAAVRGAGYAVTDRDGPAAGGALPVHFVVHSGAAGVDVAVLQIGEQTLTRGYMSGQPVTGWSFDAQNAPPRTLERLSLVQRGIPINQVTYAYAGAGRPAAAVSPGPAPQGSQP